MYRYFQEVLHALFTLVTMETDHRCLDNICAAVCRMIMTQPNAIPLDQVNICNYTRLMSHNFACELTNNTKLASFTVLCLVSVVSNLYTYSLPTE